MKASMVHERSVLTVLTVGARLAMIQKMLMHVIASTLRVTFQVVNANRKGAC